MQLKLDEPESAAEIYTQMLDEVRGGRHREGARDGAPQARRDRGAPAASGRRGAHAGSPQLSSALTPPARPDRWSRRRHRAAAAAADRYRYRFIEPNAADNADAADAADASVATGLAGATLAAAVAAGGAAARRLGQLARGRDGSGRRRPQFSRRATTASAAACGRAVGGTLTAAQAEGGTDAGLGGGCAGAWCGGSGFTTALGARACRSEARLLRAGQCERMAHRHALGCASCEY
eukprot:scaffold15145_cov54-Phaeocystis_antarctica.AAC.4